MQPAGLPSSFILPAGACPNGVAQAMTWASSIGNGDVYGGYVNNSYDWISEPSGAGPDSFAILPPDFSKESASGFKNSWSFLGWGSTGDNTWSSPAVLSNGSFVTTIDKSAGSSGEGAWLSFVPAPLIPAAPGASMVLALADTITGYLNSLQLASPGALGVSFTAKRAYLFHSILPTLNGSYPATSPLVLIIPGVDNETVAGISGIAKIADGEYSVRIIVLAYVGQMQADQDVQFNALADPLLDLRQSIRNVVAASGALNPIYGGRTANCRAVSIDKGDNGPLGAPYDYAVLNVDGILISDQTIDFMISPV